MKTCRFCGDEYDPRHPYHRLGYIDQCGNCADERPEDLVIGIEEPPTNKASCEVTVIHRDALSGAVKHYVNFSQRYQRIGPKR